MKKGLIALIGILVVLGIGACSIASGYNSMVRLDESVEASWSQVENQYQRRMDLIPNLVNVVKGYAKHESEVFTNIAEARSKLGGTVNINDPDALKAYQENQAQLGNTLGGLLALTESYPELKADKNFLELQDQLEGTENRISVERKRFNDTVKAYNRKIRSFPTNILANMFGFEKRPYFEAEKGAEKAPKVEF